MPKTPRLQWEGWAEFWSYSRHRPYWENPNLSVNIRIRWHQPHGWPHPHLDPPLPRGWVKLFDESQNNHPYYYNTETDITQWEVPVENNVKEIVSTSKQYHPPVSTSYRSKQEPLPDGIHRAQTQPAIDSQTYFNDHKSKPHTTGPIIETKPAPQFSAPEGVAGVGKSFLTDLSRRHSKWIWGGLAEILHNSKDAGAKNIRIQRFPESDSSPESKDFGLQIDDDGSGITYDEACTMMQIASDHNFKAKEGQVGGYGVGFKVGAMAMAQTAIVLSISVKDESTGTTVVGVLSNEPFEERGEFPLGLRRPNTEIIALLTKNGRVYEDKGIKEVDRDELCKKTQRLNSVIDRDWITTWAGRRQGKPGTTIILCGVRHQFRSNDLGQGCRVHDPPRVRIDFQPNDMVLMEYNDFTKTSVTFRHHPTARRIIGHSAAKMDSSFKAFCEMMFLMEGSTKDLNISLFGRPIERVDWNKVLRRKIRTKLRDNGIVVQAMLGQHGFTDDTDLYGAMLYCENTLITAFARPHNLEFRRGRGSKEDEEHFSSVLVVNLLKKHGFEPTPEKLEFNFNDAKKEQFWEGVKGKIEDYADQQASVRDEKFPLRPLFLNFIKDLKIRLRDHGIMDLSGECALRGVLYTPDREDTCSDRETYHEFIKDPISLRDVELKAKFEGNCSKVTASNACYKGDTMAKIRAFKEDLMQIFKNSINWESKGRFIADTVDDMDINDVGLEDIHAATTKFFVCPSSGTKGPFTIKGILKKLDIPKVFRKAMLEANQIGYPGLEDFDTELQHSTTVLVPHRQSVAAVKFAKELLTIVETQVGSFPALLQAKEKAKTKGTVDDLVQCSTCHNWRKFPGAVVKYGEINFRCEMEGRSCEEPDDFNTHSDVQLAPLHNYSLKDNIAAVRVNQSPSKDAEANDHNTKKRLIAASSPNLGSMQRKKKKRTSVLPEPCESTSSTAASKSNVPIVDDAVPDPTSSSKTRPTNPPSLIATAFNISVSECTSSLKKKQQKRMQKKVLEMLKLWRRAEKEEQEMFVYDGVDMETYGKLLRDAKAAKVSAQFLDTLNEVHAGIIIVKKQIKQRKEKSQDRTSANSPLHKPPELASSTLHKEPRKIRIKEEPLD
eukprot:CAMPEP_0194384844 /NCGR_PEP_ID=MMETSP0174-20130528/76518_1 /TAXON_ID=216777 /ORGANISM="Proboscia alata, Strain PI-D3" /LENGTH=1114 /DNA_ID=CAMNT_0039172387 /DNA_START=69 /DNA_END=3413 /DNA_ORIENTATION=-